MLKLTKTLLPLVSVLTLSSIAFLPETTQAGSIHLDTTVPEKQTNGIISVSPIKIEANAEQGQARGIIEIQNIGNQPFRGRISAEPFTYNREGLVTEKSNPQDLTLFLSFSPREVVIEPGQVRRIRLVSQFLPSTPNGEYRAVIFIEGLEAQSQARRIETTIYVRQGKTAPKLEVQSASFDPQTKRIVLLVRNLGNASIFPKTVWTLKQGESTVNRGETQEYAVIAGSERNIAIDFLQRDQRVVPGKYQLTGDLVSGDRANPEKLQFDVKVQITP